MDAEWTFRSFPWLQEVASALLPRYSTCSSARAGLERRFGYDTKHAMHLLKMGAEILKSGQVHVYRPDGEWLMAVRDGLLTHE